MRSFLLFLSIVSLGIGISTLGCGNLPARIKEGGLFARSDPTPKERKRALIEDAVTWGVREAPLLSSQGQPIGIRVTYYLRFKRYHAFYSEEDLLLEATSTTAFPTDLDLSVDHSTTTFLSQPSRKGFTYQVVVDLVPSVLRRDSTSGLRCIGSCPCGRFELDQELTRTRRTAYRLSYGIRGKPSYLTREYSPAQFYRNAVAAGAQPCS